MESVVVGGRDLICPVNGKTFISGDRDRSGRAGTNDTCTSSCQGNVQKAFL